MINVHGFDYCFLAVVGISEKRVYLWHLTNKEIPSNGSRLVYRHASMPGESARKRWDEDVLDKASVSVARTEYRCGPASVDEFLPQTSVGTLVMAWGALPRPHLQIF